MTGGIGAGQALGAGAGCVGRWASERRALARGTGRRTGGRGAGFGARALGAAWACRWPTGCSLGALGLFLAQFDSVLFLSQFLDIVREPGS